MYFTGRLFKTVRQSSRILQRHKITQRHCAHIFAATVTVCSPHHHRYHRHHTGNPSQEAKSKQAHCSLFQARVLQICERLECRLPWVTKEKETAMACKQSCNLVLLRVHRVPSNQTQPMMLDSQQWQCFHCRSSWTVPSTEARNHNKETQWSCRRWSDITQD